MGYRVLLPCLPVTRHSRSERRPQPATLKRIGLDSLPDQSYRYVRTESVLTGFDLAETVPQKRVQDEQARASSLSQSPRDALWTYSTERPVFVKNRSRAFPQSNLRSITLCLKALSGPCQNQSQSPKRWLRKFLRLDDPWTKDLKSHQWCKKLDIRTMTWKTCRLRRLLQGKGQHQMTSPIRLPQVEGRLVTDNDPIRYSQNTIPAWSQPVANTCVLLGISPKYGTFAQASEFF